MSAPSGTPDTLHHADSDLEIHKLVVGPVENNVFVLRCRHTGDAVQNAGAQAVTRQENALLITSAPEARREILAALEAAGGRVVRFATEEPSLEDIYLQYIKQEGAK